MNEKNVIRLQSVSVEAGMVLSAIYTGGNTIRVDLTDVARRLEVFAPLESRRALRTALAGSHVSRWPNTRRPNRHGRFQPVRGRK
jgi:hypothetical protein